jgi:serine/threonine protein phosphatase PrpC
MPLFGFWRRKPAPAPSPAARAPGLQGRLGIASAMRSDRGRVRASNEDAIVYIAGEAADAFDLIAAVADGMGGHAAGEVASEIAVTTLRKVLKEARSEPRVALAAAFREANGAIRDYALSHPETRGMGTTCTAIFVRADKLWLGHIGDSRAYLLREGALEQLTEDHTLRAQLIREGAISEEDAGVAAGVLLRALGAADEVEPMLPPAALPLLAEDRVLLCSDGLHGVVTVEAISAALQLDDPGLACEALVEAALAAGAPDNVSVGVFLFREPAGIESVP